MKTASNGLSISSDIERIRLSILIFGLVLLSIYRNTFFFLKTQKNGQNGTNLSSELTRKKLKITNGTLL